MTVPCAIYADWPVPDTIVAFTTCRMGSGSSQFPYEQFNLADHVGDVAETVTANRKALIQCCDGLETIQWLEQVHGTRIVTAGEQLCPAADGSISSESGVACAVMTADCLPLVLCDQQGRQIAAVHAGWRGLADGVIEAAVAKFHSPADNLMVWMGPAISQQNYEVGEEVRQQFIDAATPTEKKPTALAFTRHLSKKNHFLVDLYQLARIRLGALSVSKIYGGGLCAYADSQRFYSYRRDGVTGRMVTMIYKKNVD